MCRETVTESVVERMLGRYGGLVVAGLGFLLTRLLVAEAVTLSGSPLVVAAKLLPLIVGLGITIAGIGLAVGAFTPSYVADVTRGCLVGTGSMVVVLLATVAGTGISMFAGPFETRLLVANVMLGGAVGGIVNGHRKASIRRHTDEVMRGANRARFINRLLRHEVLNAATIIDGHAELLREETGSRDRSVDAIRNGAERIESTVAGVGKIAEAQNGGGVRVEEALETAVQGRSEEGTSAVDVSVSDEIAAVELDADDRLGIAIDRLIEHATDVRDATRVSIDVEADRHTVTIGISDTGAPLSATGRDVLERGSFPEYDDPTSGFALQAVNLIVGSYDGRIQVENGDGTRIELVVPRRSADAADATVGVPYPDLQRAATAGIVGGVAMGGIYWLFSGVLPVIGALYGTESVTVGWITHLFHSVVFALLLVAGASRSRVRKWIVPQSNGPSLGPLRPAAVGIAWGAVLWFVAAGLIMPIWLRTVGLPAPLPNLPTIGFLAHGVWGATVGAGYVLLGGRFD